MTALEDVKTSRGTAGNKLLGEAKQARTEFRTLRTQFSAVFGTPDAPV